MLNQNGNGAARPSKVERGISLAHRTRDTKQQRAAKAADIYDGRTIYQPTQAELAWIYEVSVTLINRARQLLPDQRKRVAQGHASLPRPALLKLKTNGASAEDQALFNIIATVGVEKALTIAAAVEQAQHHLQYAPPIRNLSRRRSLEAQSKSHDNRLAA
jgi:hypothetical protein